MTCRSCGARHDFGLVRRRYVARGRREPLCPSCWWDWRDVLLAWRRRWEQLQLRLAA